MADISTINIIDVFKVTTKLQTQNKQGRTSYTRKEDKNKLSESDSYSSVINTEECYKMARLYFKNNNFVIQCRKNELYEPHNHIINENIDLEHLLPNLEKVYNNNSFAYLQLS